MVEAMATAGKHMPNTADTPMTDDDSTTLSTDDAPAQLLDDLRTAKNSIAATAYVVRLSTIRPPTTPTTIYDWITLTLLAAPGRGVRCQMLISHPLSSGSLGLIDQASRKALMAAGWQLRQPPPVRLLHAKTWLIDGRIVWVGSHNLTAKTMIYNREASMRTTSATVARQYATWHTAMWHKSTPP